MAWRCSGSSNLELVENLYKNRLITSERVRDAMANVDRKNFCPDASSAYEDSPQSIGHGATISAPHMHASACEALLPYLQPGAKVLDIGSGSGYLTAVLAELVAVPEGQIGGSARVVGVEHIAELAHQGRGNLMKTRRGKELLRNGKVEFVVADGRLGYGGTEGYWDAIHVGAAAVEVHAELVRQLKAPGRLFIPVDDEQARGQWIWVVDKDAKSIVNKVRKEGVRYVPLTDAPEEGDPRG